MLASILTAGAAIIGGLVSTVTGSVEASAKIKELSATQQRIQFEVEAAKRFYDALDKMGQGDEQKLPALVERVNSFRAKVRNISYSYAFIGNEFDNTYGEDQNFFKKYNQWQKQTDESLKDAMIAQGLIEKSERHLIDLDHILSIKRKAKSDSDTLHAIGEINALQMRQLAELAEIISVSSRAQQSALMEKIAKKRERQKYEAHLMKDFNNHRSSKPLSRFPSLGTTTY